MRGRRRAAQASWADSLAAAAALEMPYEEARAHLEIARHLPALATVRQHHLDEAHLTFTRLGAVHELQRTRAASAVAEPSC